MCAHRFRVQLLHNEAVRVDGRGRRWRRGTPFVQRGRTAAQGAGTLGRAVPQPAARGQHAASRGRGRRAPVARRPRAPAAVAHVHAARAGRQPETGAAAVAAPAAAVADHRLQHHRRGHRHRDGTAAAPAAAGRHGGDRVATAAVDVVVRVQQLNLAPPPFHGSSPRAIPRMSSRSVRFRIDCPPPPFDRVVTWSNRPRVLLTLRV